MARLNRPPVLLLALFLLLLAAAVARGQPAPGRLYDPASSRPTGLLLLREWLREMGYRVTTTGSRGFHLPADADLLFVYPGAERFTDTEASQLREWVEGGGTLVLVAVDDLALHGMFGYDFDSGYVDGAARQVQPLLPEGETVLRGQGGPSLDLGDAPTAVSVLAAGDANAPVLAVLRRGLGWVWLLSGHFTFTNSELMDRRQPAAIVPALLRAVPDGGTVAFDTYHLFGPDPLAGPASIETLQDWAYRTPTGWATLFLLLLGFVYLLLDGRRLGPPLVTAAQGRRREAAEFVVAMAGLQRRARVRDSLARHHRQRLKQALGKPWRIPPDLPDGEFLEQLRALDPRLSDERAARLGRLLAELARLPDEKRLVELVAEADGIVSNE